MTAENTKTCVGCSRVFHRPNRKGESRLMSISVWRKTRFCSRPCFFASGEYRLRQSEIAKERGYGLWMTGKTASEEAKAKTSRALKGRKRSNPSPSLETRQKLSDALKGPKSHLWRGGKTAEGAAIRSSMKYRHWRQAVFQRDDFTCLACGERGGSLHADHIKPFALFPELRFDLRNGRTLCEACHKQTPTYLKAGKQLVEACFPAVQIEEI